MERYDYIATVSSADGYKCRLFFSVGGYIGDQILFGSNDIWGGGAGVADSPKEKRLPEELFVQYYSMPENTFYRLKTPLPTERIKELLKKRHPLRDIDDASYVGFDIGIAPCGFVSLWLAGTYGMVLVDTFRAQPFKYDYISAFPPASGTPPAEIYKNQYNGLYSFIKREIQDNKISSKYWEDLNNMYNWKLEVSDPNFKLYNYEMYFINQEWKRGFRDPSWLLESSLKRIPSEFDVFLSNKFRPIRYSVEIKIRQRRAYKDEDEKLGPEQSVLNHMNKSRELLAIFDEFYAKAGDKPVRLCLELSNDLGVDRLRNLKLKLKTDDMEVEIPTMSVKVFPSNEYNIDRFN